ncbi:AAA family ATPase [Nocardia sp. NPDC127579]|uniref:AAA family ATPase n=1 Tax=Nocardia sp. NPDC127579 TaxID=3345402 RepID=UPI0036400F40
MLVWINGPFGGGKTQTAFELRRRLHGSVVCDPEFVGYGLHRSMPAELRGDFQDLPAWRQGVVEVLDLVLNQHKGVVIAPMTVVHPDYFAETVGRLREIGHDVRHFALLAEHDTVRERLRGRGLPGMRFGLRFETFALERIDHCLEALQRPEFGEHIHTDHLGVAAVADRIAASANLTLTPNTDSALRTRLRQARVTLSHIRL